MYPAGRQDIQVRYVTTQQPDRIRVLESGPAGAHAVVLLHGCGGSVYTFVDVIPALAAAGYRAIAIDLQGFGLSDKPVDAARYTIAAFAESVVAVIDALRLPSFSLVGHSMGGAIALHLALSRPPALQRLVLICAAGLGRVPIIAPTRLLTPAFMNRVLPMMLTRRAITMVLRFAFAAPGRPTIEDVEEYWAPSQFDEFAWACRACLHRTDWTPIGSSALQQLRIPVLALAGGRDRVVRGSAQRARLIPGARVVVLPHAGHVVPQQCAAETMSELLAFLRQPVRA